MLELDKAHRDERYQIENKLEAELEQLIRQNKSQEAVELMLDKEYLHKSHIKTDKHERIWSNPVDRLIERYPEYALALQKKCKFLQADPLQKSLREEIDCDFVERRLQNKLKFESVLEKLILDNQAQKALNLVADVDTKYWGHNQFWGNQGINKDPLIFYQSFYMLANKYPSFQTAWKKKCRSVQRIVLFDPSIPDGNTKPKNKKGEIRLPPESSALYPVWAELYCDYIEDIYNW